MSSWLWLANVVSYSLQVAILVVAGGVLPFLLRLRMPKARLLCWQSLLAGCLLLPAIQPWNSPPIPRLAAVSPATAAAVTDQASPQQRPPAAADTILFALGIGFVARSCWLILGFLSLRRYRLDAREMSPLPAAVERASAWSGAHPRVYLSRDTKGPVTFGLIHPVVLFPTPFLEMAQEVQQALAFHEYLHVRRRDWAFAIVEEFIRCVLWFHPAIWWLLGRIHLAREQTVDHEVTRLTENRNQYIEALLAIASGNPQPDLAPAPLFLRKRHLAQRVASLVKEIPMSKQRMIVSLIAIMAALLITGRMAVSALPLQAPPRSERAVSVEGGEANLLHRPPIQYPREALEKRIEGSVVLELSVNDSGTVSDARVLSGPEELRRAALLSVLQWHYSKDMQLPAKVQVTIQFRLPESGPVLSPEPRATPSTPQRNPHSTVKRIQIDGLPPGLAEDLRNHLPVRVGDELTNEAISRLGQIVQETDIHLAVSYQNTDGGVDIRIFLPGSVPQAIRVGGKVQQTNLIQKQPPVYPPLAKQAGIAGVVLLNATIGKDGAVKQLTVESGHPLLVPAALEAVKNWVYRPTLLNGEPVEVVTQIEVNFTLADL